jgi:hypothetical protein
MVTVLVMSQFLDFLDAARGCADFRDPTAVLTWVGFGGLAKATYSLATFGLRINRLKM